MKRRSFSLSGEIESKLIEIQQVKRLNNLSEAMRFSIDKVHEELLFQPPTELVSTVEKNAILLRYLLIEVCKTHGGKRQISQPVKDYLALLNKEISEHIKNKTADDN